MISFNANSLVGTIAGINGNGVLALVNFTAIGFGSSPVNISGVTLLDSAFLDIPADVAAGTVQVQSGGGGGGSGAVPEPASLWLVALGIGWLGMSASLKISKFRKIAGATLAIIGATFSMGASALPYYWVDWQSWNPSGGKASGVITPSSGPQVNVGFDALTANGTPGSYLGVTGNYLWNPAATYQSTQVDNAPTFEGIQLVGTQNMTYRVTLSEPIKDPRMAITTLGAGNDSATYVFDSPFTILSQGPTCCWGGGYNKLIQLPNNVLEGWEGAGVIHFIRTYSTVSWMVPDPDYWHGFTFGIRTTERLEPTPPPTGVPEPASFVLIGLGLAVIAGLRHCNVARGLFIRYTYPTSDNPISIPSEFL